MASARPSFTKSLQGFIRAGAVASAIAAGVGIAQAETTVTAVMHSDLRMLDPIVTTAHITRNHAYMIYDVLIAPDADFVPRPQMADWTRSPDGKTYTFTLRDGLKFHDGTPVTAADAVASLQRWARRDSGGQMLLEITDSLKATDEKTLVWALKERFEPFIDILGKQVSYPPFIMPARIAATPSDKPISEHIGSGPFKFVPEEFRPGVGVTYVKNKEYTPRAEPPNGMAGGKVVNVDRVRWVTMPDAQTSVNALKNGEIDYIEQVPVDLLALIEGDDNIIVERRHPMGYQTMGRMNFKYPPFDNPDIRRAALLALSQEPVLAAMMGNPKYYRVCGSIFGCGSALETTVGSETLTGKGDPEAARALLKKAGYTGRPVVILQPTDTPNLATQPVVAAQLLRKAGFTVDLQPMDWQSLVARRASREPPEKGGWNMFFTNWQVVEMQTPITSSALNGRGDKGWFGWPDDERIEALKSEYGAAQTLEERRAVAKKLQARALENVLIVPLGEYNPPQARRTLIVDMIRTPVPVFWNMRKTVSPPQ